MLPAEEKEFLRAREEEIIPSAEEDLLPSLEAELLPAPNEELLPRGTRSCCRPSRTGVGEGVAAAWEDDLIPEVLEYLLWEWEEDLLPASEELLRGVGGK